MTTPKTPRTQHPYPKKVLETLAQAPDSWFSPYELAEVLRPAAVETEARRITQVLANLAARGRVRRTFRNGVFVYRHKPKTPSPAAPIPASTPVDATSPDEQALRLASAVLDVTLVVMKQLDSPGLTVATLIERLDASREGLPAILRLLRAPPP